MTWLVMALMAPLLWSLSNILDKLAVIHHANHWTTFIFLLSIGNLLYSALIFLLFTPSDFDTTSALLNLLSGLCIFGMYFLYAMPLKSVDISTAIALHQLTPLLVLVVSILLLGYSPTGIELLGIALVFVGVYFAVAIGKGRPGSISLSAVLLLIGSAVFGAVATLLYDHLLLSHSLPSVLMFNYAGYGLGGTLMLLVPKWRHSIAKDVSEMPPKGWAVYALSNLFDAGGYALFIGALSAGGNVAVVSVLVSLHPVYVLALSHWLAIVDPKILSENFSSSDAYKRMSAIVVMVAGVIMMTKI
ncbi:EamA family transporter [Pseudomonas aeruginosa]|uniref:EamA family transporter n=1 Tax=Pseudomonas aeruginosa TaxID=287 RepID=UPI00373E6294